MTRHPIDHDKTRGETARLKQYLKVEKAKKPSGATKDLQRRPRALSDSARVQAFMRIQREA